MSSPSDPVAAKPATQTSLASYFGAAALVALIALGVTVWQGHDTRQEMDALRQELAKKLSDADAQAKAGKQFAEQLREATREAGAKIAALEAKLSESQSQQIALEALYQELSRNRDEWAYAEIEQTLLVASQQLQLAGNVKAALIALQAADSRLAAMNRPQLVALRKAINQDVTRLKALPFIDSVGISVRLDNIVNAVDKLPLAAEGRSMPEPAEDKPGTDSDVPAWRRYWAELLNDMRQLVRVQRMDRPDVPLLAPSQAFFLRENLKLRLLSSRLALLSRDQTSYKNDLKAARDWLTRYFDTRDKTVAAMMATLASLHGNDISIELPDISATLDALRTSRQVRERAKP
jgi:uroporphyrin-3 C-methyltransferase